MKVSLVLRRGAFLMYLQCCKVDDAVDVRILCKDLLQSSFICEVNLVEFWSLSAEEFDTVQGDL